MMLFGGTNTCKYVCFKNLQPRILLLLWRRWCILCTEQHKHHQGSKAKTCNWELKPAEEETKHGGVGIAAARFTVSGSKRGRQGWRIISVGQPFATSGSNGSSLYSCWIIPGFFQLVNNIHWIYDWIEKSSWFNPLMNELLRNKHWTYFTCVHQK